MYEIEILSKAGFENVRGEHVHAEILQLGFKDVNKVEYSPLYKIEGQIDAAQAKTIALELLSDKITEKHRLTKDGVSKKEKASVIEVWFKKGVTDTVSESVIKAVKDLGINNDISVKTGHKYYLYGKISNTVLDKIAAKLLANTLIQEYKIK
ncbi:MAG: phosphoribosylformylglycinamidine synthase subunit PurS [Endomicrobium sp.]|jgi:phosphoribosylformylglycinamidine synthase|nr:phosphoribosylformylglycinamidine synthase subunit PurS [Endomicrobium sp.]